MRKFPVKLSFSLNHPVKVITGPIDMRYTKIDVIGNNVYATFEYDEERKTQEVYCFDVTRKVVDTIPSMKLCEFYHNECKWQLVRYTDHPEALSAETKLAEKQAKARVKSREQQLNLEQKAELDEYNRNMREEALRLLAEKVEAARERRERAERVKLAQLKISKERNERIAKERAAREERIARDREAKRIAKEKRELELDAKRKAKELAQQKKLELEQLELNAPWHGRKATVQVPLCAPYLRYDCDNHDYRIILPECCNITQYGVLLNHNGKWCVQVFCFRPYCKLREFKIMTSAGLRILGISAETFAPDNMDTFIIQDCPVLTDKICSGLIANKAVIPAGSVGLRARHLGGLSEYDLVGTATYSGDFSKDNQVDPPQSDGINLPSQPG